jgi:PAS domain S-box-containing protein
MKNNTPSKINNPQSLRVLIVEDSEDDALLIIRNLKKCGYNPVHERVETAAAMKKALKEKRWDIILCDYKMPKFNAPSAISILKGANLNIPIIIVSGTIGEDVGIECMRLGAHDYIIKGNLSRLCPAIARELEEAEVKNRQKQAEFQRETALEELRQSEEKHRTILDNIEDGYYEVDLKGNFTFFNDSMCRIMGYSKDELMGMNNRQITDKENAKIVFQAFNKVYNTGAPTKEFNWQVIRKNGTERYIEQSASLKKDSSGKITGFRGIIHDITERKRAEDVLRQSEERYRSILETIREGYFEVDLAGNFTFFNDSICRILGYSKEEVMGMNNRQYTDKENSKILFQVFNKVYNSGEPTEGFDWQILRKDGTKKYVEASVSLQKDSSDKPIGFKGIVRDVTERKWAEEAQRLSEENFRHSLKDLPLGVRIVTMEGETVYANQAILDIYGYASIEELKTTPVEKRYTSKSYAEYQIRRKKRKEGDDAPYEYYIDILKKNGEVRHLHVFRKDILWNGERQFQVLYSDITERKWAEEALLESEEKLKMALTGAEMGMWDLNLTTMSGAVDERAAQILGYRKDHIPPQSYFWDEMTHPDDVPRIKEKIKAHLEGRTPVFKTEHRMRTATGEWKWVHGRGKITKRHIDGSPIQISGTIHDITDRKQAEERIKSSLREKEILLREVHHRVKNNMQVISGLLDLPAALSGNQERRRMFHESQSRIHAMSLVHEKLYESDDLARIDLADYVRTMSQDLFQTYKINPGKIDLIIKTNGDVYVDINKAIPCGLILNELISNALKHAFPGDRHGALQIIIRGMKKTEIEIVVRDNGLGLPDDVDIHQPESVGLHLVNGLVKNQLDGQIEIRRNAGTEILIKFPL